MSAKHSMLYSEIEAVLQNLKTATVTIDRKELLKPLIDYIQSKVTQQKEIRLNFICTHNSRRSHLAQVWAQVAATYYGIPNVFCYSGGTEATALYPQVAKTLENQGFKIQPLSAGNNPVYAINYAQNGHPVIAFSKTYFDDFNPVSEFAAIMTCTNADGDCPFIPGAEKRIPITFNDPKEFDNTPSQEAKYEERSLQIALEMFYVFSQINS
ncbi:MAG: protein-tyrosine-phosphatase [Bacteroidetes bacterium]|nr:protein-tyrosine-phosphatase [Bacteroidota bacterium]MBK9672901.1 protein-tyrosine-phosphatase [Bacteroidota bacterium]MBK9801001.1 protein-tyrosine-phosphatase [Bacteroidota bacterium]MBP6413986.1 protein-tyrosine-phosphatase [Bacteroidia bacterium]